MNLLSISAVALFVIFIAGEFCGYVLKIYSDRFFSWFHFTGGFFLYLFCFSLIKDVFTSIILVITIGTLWELHEWILYYTILKRNKHYRPDDSLADLFFDVLGAAGALVIIKLF